MSRQFLTANYCVDSCDTLSPYVKYGSVCIFTPQNIILRGPRFSLSPCTLLVKNCLKVGGENFHE
jgi:hypothetical protein